MKEKLAEENQVAMGLKSPSQKTAFGKIFGLLILIVAIHGDLMNFMANQEIIMNVNN